MRRRQLNLVGMLAVASIFPSIDAHWNRPYCRLEDLPIVLLHLDQTKGEYTLVKRLGFDADSLTEGNFRHLQSTDLVEGNTANLRRRWTPGITTKGSDRELSPIKDIVVANDIKEQLDEETLISNTASSDESVPQNLDFDTLFYARECSCFVHLPTSYCPFTVETCQYPQEEGNGHAECLTVPPSPKRTKFLFFMTLVCYAMMAVLLFCTRYGQNACDYALSCVIPGWTHRRVDQVAENDPYWSALLIRQFYIREHRRLTIQLLQLTRRVAATGDEQSDQRRQGLQAIASMFTVHRVVLGGQTQPTNTSPSQTISLEPKALALKTTVFRKENRDTCDENEDDEGDGCIICFASIEDGDRVAALKCGHLFHVDCLKNWLRKKNTCPLCQASGIATPHQLLDASPSGTTELDSALPADSSTADQHEPENYPSSSEDSTL